MSTGAGAVEESRVNERKTTRGCFIDITCCSRQVPTGRTTALASTAAGPVGRFLLRQRREHRRQVEPLVPGCYRFPEVADLLHAINGVGDPCVLDARPILDLAPR